jgi:hypothetical protein
VAISQLEKDVLCPFGTMNSKAADAPQAPFFSLLAQRKEGKRKGTLLSPDHCASRRSRREKNSALCASNTFSLHP